MPNRANPRASYSKPQRGLLAARHTLLMEVLLGWYMMTLGYSGQTGGDGTGVLHMVLEKMGLDDIWGYYFIAVGYLMLQNAAVEFFLGRYWGDEAIRWMAIARSATSLASIFAWVITLYLLIQTPLSVFKGLELMTPLAVALSSYTYWETTRVHSIIGGWSVTTAR